MYSAEQSLQQRFLPSELISSLSTTACRRAGAQTAISLGAEVSEFEGEQVQKEEELSARQNRSCCASER